MEPDLDKLREVAKRRSRGETVPSDLTRRQAREPAPQAPRPRRADGPPRTPPVAETWAPSGTAIFWLIVLALAIKSCGS